MDCNRSGGKKASSSACAGHHLKIVAQHKSFFHGKCVNLSLSALQSDRLQYGERQIHCTG